MRYLWLTCFFLGAITCLLTAQIKVGTVRGTVVDETGGVLPGATVRLANPISGYTQERITSPNGEFEFNDVPFNTYNLSAEFPEFQTQQKEIHLHSNIPVEERITLQVGAVTVRVEVEAHVHMVEEDTSVTKTTLDESALTRMPPAPPGRGLSPIIATTPGWVPDDNGRMHARGTESSILYVTDGVPIVDRLDAGFAPSLDARSVQSLEIITGNIPAEYGNRLGGVVNVQFKSGLDKPFSGDALVNFGNFDRQEASLVLGGEVSHELALSFAGHVGQSDRFLDAPTDQNFHNHGGSIKLNFKLNWHPTENDMVRFFLTGDGTDFQVPNRLQQELAGQNSRQELRTNTQSLMWQHIWSANTVSNIAAYRRFFEAALEPSPFDVPISARQDREHSQQGFLASVSHAIGPHHMKLGLEIFRTPLKEFFSFVITRPDEVEATPAAARHVAGNPFTFRDETAGEQYSGYVQGSFKAAENFTIDAGLRYDNYHLLIADDQFSPRIGAVYFFPQTNTAVRASYNRLFMPPQYENILLASSPQAAALSPFAEVGGAALIEPDKEHVYEIGLAQSILDLFRLDVAYYWKNIRNFHDRDQFLDTGIIFPISIAKGDVEGLDIRLDLPAYKGISAYGSWSNSRAFGIGPINGGLFLSEEVEEIGPGFVFPNDHDQRNSVAFGATYVERRQSWWVTFQGRHDSGLPLEVEEEAIPELKELPGANLVNFDRQRVKPRTIFDLSAGANFRRKDSWELRALASIENLFNKRFLYNFESVFGGTHFGHPRLYTLQLQFVF